MMNTLKFLLRNQLKSSKVIQQASGFTLIELLVGVIMAVLIITPLLGLMLNVLNTDKQEQAKANSEQEVQAALDYIARDLKQAVYIYDAGGIDKIKASLPDQVPTVKTDRVPVLVFWKRELVSNVLEAKDKTKDDTFVLSLVAYYLIKDSSTIWHEARIGRWEIKDGVPSTTTTGTSCTGYSGTYVSADYCPSPGFAPFNLDEQGTLEERMNKWTKATADYTNDTLALVDYIDQTTTGTPATACPADTKDPPITWSKVTPDSFNGSATGKMTSFYACVDRANTTAQIFIRGNALARIQNNTTYNSGRTTYFPTVNARVQGRGYLYK